jgi:hypothetical protein
MSDERFADLLEAVVALVRRYVVLTDTQAAAVALWTVHTHALEAAETTPYLAITSPEKRSGKTRLLDVLELVVAAPWRAITPTEAVTFRKIERDQPTLLLDEADAIFGPKAREHEGLRALLNAGNRRGTMVPRCVGPSHALHDFAVFCPKALAGIGELPDTVTDRAVRIRLKRKAPGETAGRFRRREAEPEAVRLRDQLSGSAKANVPRLVDARPAIPAELDDRAAEAWEPLLAIADLAGEPWPAMARAAALDLSSGEQREDDSIGVRLLADVREAFGDADRMSTEGLLGALCADDEAPWGDWRGKPLSARALGRLLRRYGVASRSIRFPDDTTLKGFLREQFDDPWSRYLPSAADAAVTSVTTASLSQRPGLSDPSQAVTVTDTGMVANRHEKPSVTDVTDGGAPAGNGTHSGVPRLGEGGFRNLLRDRRDAGHLTEAEYLDRLGVNGLVLRYAGGPGR